MSSSIDTDAAKAVALKWALVLGWPLVILAVVIAMLGCWAFIPFGRMRKVGEEQEWAFTMDREQR